MVSYSSWSWGTVKPPPGTPINRGHPLSQGLVFCVIPQGVGPIYDVVNGIRLTPQTNASMRPLGAYSGTGASASGWVSGAITQSTLQPATTVSMLWRGLRVGSFTGGFGYLLGLSSSGSFTTPFNAYCLDDGSVTNGVRLAWNTAGSTGSSASFTAAQTTGIHQYVGIILPGRQTAFQRAGIPISMSSASISSITYNSGLIGIGAHPTSTSTPTNTVTELACIWNRTLSFAECAWLYQEPYAMFMPPGV